jgi:hypothetical protein
MSALLKDHPVGRENLSTVHRATILFCLGILTILCLTSDAEAWGGCRKRWGFWSGGCNPSQCNPSPCCSPVSAFHQGQIPGTSTWHPMVSGASSLSLSSSGLIHPATVRARPVPRSAPQMGRNFPSAVIGAAVSDPTSGFPTISNKPVPKNIVVEGCPAEGDGGDPDLNRLKNRVDDTTNWYPVLFDNMFNLPWPEGIQHKNRSQWSSGDRQQVARFEGLPISTEGYLARVKLEGPESCNCHSTDPMRRDFHIYLTKSKDQEIPDSIVVEMTPPVRANHPAWQLQAIRTLVDNQDRVRISGWLMLDQEHANQVGQYRGTIWEIHPVMKVEVEMNGTWTVLDAAGGN